MRHGACEMLQGLYDISMKLVEGVLKLAPYGVAALLFVMTARIGPSVIRPIAAYVGVVILGLVIHNFIVYSISVKVFGGISPRRFFPGVRVAMVTAVATPSSCATPRTPPRA